MLICSKYTRRGEKRRGGEGFLRGSKRRHLPTIRTFKKFGHFLFGQIDRQTRRADKQTLWFIGKLHFQKLGEQQHFYTGGETLLIRAANGKLPCSRTWNNIKKIFFNIPSRKLDKNVNLFHLNMNFFKVKQKKYHAF